VQKASGAAAIRAIEKAAFLSFETEKRSNELMIDGKDRSE
jgi:hypothetical protein